MKNWKKTIREFNTETKLEAENGQVVLKTPDGEYSMSPEELMSMKSPEWDDDVIEIETPDMAGRSVDVPKEVVVQFLKKHGLAEAHSFKATNNSMKTITENWRKFLQEEKPVDLRKLSDEEKALLDKILAVAKEEQLSEARPGSAASRARSRKRSRERASQKIKAEKKKIELEYWKTHVEGLVNGTRRSTGSLVVLSAYRSLDCRSQDCSALWNLPVDGIEPLKNQIGQWRLLDQYYKKWFEDNKENWEGDIDMLKAKRGAVDATITDVSELPGLSALKNNSLYKSLSKKLCPDSMSTGISLACLGKLSLNAVDFFATE